jgi:hypothetical protein
MDQNNGNNDNVQSALNFFSIIMSGIAILSLIVSLYFLLPILGVGVDKEKEAAKSFVRGKCMSLDPAAMSSSAGLMPMAVNVLAFGQAKVDEWCECAYNEVSKTFTNEQIASAGDAGFYDPITEKLSAAITFSTASCIKNSEVPAEGRKQANDYADMLVQGHNARTKLGEALSSISKETSGAGANINEESETNRDWEASTSNGSSGKIGNNGDNCESLWFKRNKIYADKGFCFKRKKAIDAFGESCFPPYGELDSTEKKAVEAFKEQERANGCSEN